MPEPLDLSNLDLFQPQTQPTPVSQPQGLSEFAKGILEDIPEVDRNVVQQYLNKWDNGVQSLTAKIHKEYEDLRPIKDIFPDVEQAATAKDWVDLINNDPVQFLISYTEYLESEGIELPGTNQPTEPIQPPVEVDPVKAELDALRAELGELREFKETLTAKEQEAENSKLFDNLLKDMHTKHGDFDDQIMTAIIAQQDKFDPDKAVEKFKEVVTKYSGGTSATPPRTQSSLKILTGVQGGVPQDQTDPKKLTPKDLKALAVAALEAARDQ